MKAREKEFEFRAEIDSMRTIKGYITRFFSKELQVDQTLRGAMEKKQLEKWLLNWAETK
jgi:hypothetical protein